MSEQAGVLQAVTIHDLRPCGRGQVLAFDLVDLLRLFEPEVSELIWTVSGDLWCLGDGAAELEQVSESGAVLNGQELLRLAASVYQVIDGEFVGTLPGHTQPQLVLVAVDSSYYVVVSPNLTPLDRLRERFSDVRASPESAMQYVGSDTGADKV